MNTSATHEAYMQRCFELAVKGLGYAAPNPLVGSVVVHENKIIGEGYHEKYGSAHAEVNAINDVMAKHGATVLNQSTLYVNLEPCAHFGKTPPCADLIIEKQIPKVVIANTDPNILVAGKGIDNMRNAGINVITAVLEEEGKFLNRRFFTFHKKKRPYIILKWAQSADGFFTKNNHEQNWITGQTSKKLVHRWRSEESAILVGKQTVMTDNPQLSNRYFDERCQPLRIVLDKRLEIPSHYHLMDHSLSTLILNSISNEKTGNTEKIKLPFQNIAQEVCEVLFSKSITSVIIEGGAKTLQLFIEQNLWDEARIFTGKVIFESGIAAPDIIGTTLSKGMVGADELLILKR